MYECGAHSDKKRRNDVKRNRSHNDVILYEIVTPTVGRKRLLTGLQLEHLIQTRRRQSKWQLQQQQCQMNQVSHWIRKHGQSRDNLVTMDMLNTDRRHGRTHELNLSRSNNNPAEPNLDITASTTRHRHDNPSHVVYPDVTSSPPSPHNYATSSDNEFSGVLASSTLKRRHTHIP